MDVGQQSQVDQVAGLRGLLDPAVERRRLDVEHPKQQHDRVSVTMFVDEPQDRRRVRSCSDAKYALAAFMISLTRRSSAFSCRSRRFSSTMSVVGRPVHSPASAWS